MIKIDLDESYESWAERVRMFEYSAAIRSVEQGENIDIVMERMSQRIVSKLLHPVYKALRFKTVEYNNEKSKQEYQANYINQVTQAASSRLD